MIKHNPSILPRVRKSLKDAKEAGKSVKRIVLDDTHFKGFVLATKPSAHEQLEDYFRGVSEAPSVHLRKIPVCHMTIPADETEPIQIVEGTPTVDDEFDDSDEAPIV